MNEKIGNEKRPLYIPVKTLDSDDYIEGIGNVELALIGCGAVAAIILGAIVSGSTNNNIAGVAAGAIVIVLFVGIFRRDSTNENLLRKAMIVYRFCRIPKKYEYRHFDMLDYTDEELMEIKDIDWGEEDNA